MKENTYSTIVLGAGPVGLATAKKLSSENLPIAILEKKVTGGLLKSVNVEGKIYDIGNFIFTNDDLLLKNYPLSTKNYVSVKSKTYIRMEGDNFVDWPPHPKKIVNTPVELIKLYVSLLISKVKRNKNSDLRSYCEYFCGTHFFKNCGLEVYIENLFGSKVEDLEFELVKTRIKFIESFGIRKYLSKKIKSKIFKRSDTSLIKHFVRPYDGFDVLFSEIKKEAESSKIEIYEYQNIKNIAKVKENWKIELEDKPFFCEKLISTIPIQDLCVLLKLPIKNKINSSMLLSTFFCGPIPRKFHVLYNFTRKGCWKRITNFGFTYAPNEEFTWITAETVIHSLNGLQNSIEQICEDVKSLFPNLKFMDYEITDDAYPTYEKGSLESLNKAIKEIEDKGIILGGRQGRYDYVSATEAFKKLFRKKPNLMKG